MTTRIQQKGQVTIPTRVRQQAGLSQGDLVEFSFQHGKIVITPKVVVDRSRFPNADGEYTPAQRRAVNRGINQSLKEHRQGKSASFDTAKEFLADLHQASAKTGAKKTKQARS